jgi:branched-chain amino acid transport system permease protein
VTAESPKAVERMIGAPSIAPAFVRWGPVIGLLSVFVCLIAVPAIEPSRFVLTLLAEGLILGIWAMSLDFLLGRAGLVSFGHAAWFGLAAYVAGYFAKFVSASFLGALCAALGVTLVVSVFAAVFVTRLSGIGFGILSLAFSQILYVIAFKWVSVTGGEDGLAGIPQPSIFGYTLQTGAHFYWLVLFVAAAVFFIIYRISRSSFGQTLIAIRENEPRASFLGIEVPIHKALAFVVSAVLAAIAGTLFVFLKGSVSPTQLYWLNNGIVLMIVIMGGVGTLLGPALAGIAWVFILDETSSNFTYWHVYFGLVFILSVLFLPGGLGGLVREQWRRICQRMARN